MSAWIVTKAHIDVLVLAGVQFHVPYDDTNSSSCRSPLSAADLAAAGAGLWAENHRSVNHRYDEDTDPPVYTPPTAEVLLDPVAVVKAIDCHVYQSCEHPDWPDGAAGRYCRRLRAAAMSGLPTAAVGSDSGRRYPIGWDIAPWGIEHIAEAAVTHSAASRMRS